METELIKDRSLSSCIKMANSLLGVNFAKTLKAIWIPALLLAITVSIMGFTTLLGLPSQTPTDPHRLLLLTAIKSVTWLVAAAIWAYFLASVITLVSESGFKQNLRRSLAVVAVEVVFYILLAIIGIIICWMVLINHADKLFTHTFFMIISVVLLVWALLTGLLMVPFRYVEMRYLLSPTGSLRRNLIAYYVAGVKGGALLIGATFFTALASLCAGLVIFLPTVILFGAKASSLVGEITMNDPSGLPTYFNFLFVGSLILTTFVFMIVVVWTQFVFYYAYGSIEYRKQMKKEKQETTLQ